ncbi:MAG: mono/diheme cytochrome c family protein [Rhodothermales bacterium]|jgi:mono/diheme cytochrome c family protein
MRFALIICSLLPLSAAAQDAAEDVPLEPISTRTGVFTAEQALRGQDIFTIVCGECHQYEDFLEGFLPGWSGQTADVLFDEIRSTMPEDSPGSLRSSEYAAVIAFLLQMNGLKAGEDKLPGSVRRLKQILIEMPLPEGDS